MIPIVLQYLLSPARMNLFWNYWYRKKQSALPITTGSFSPKNTIGLEYNPIFKTWFLIKKKTMKTLPRALSDQA